MSIHDALHLFEQHIRWALDQLDYRLATDGSFDLPAATFEDDGGARRIFVALSRSDESWLPGHGRRTVYPVHDPREKLTTFDEYMHRKPPRMAVVNVHTWNCLFPACRMQRGVEIFPSLAEDGVIVVSAIGFTTLPVVITRRWRCTMHTECKQNIEIGEACMTAQRAASL